MTSKDRRIALSSGTINAKPGTTVKAFITKCGQLRLRNKATVDSMELARMNNGDKVYILAKENSEWAKVQTKNGQVGYALLSYLEVC